MIDAVLFDVGGVFMASPFTAMEQLAADRQMRYEDVLAIIFGPYDDDGAGDHPWHRAERGELDIAAAREEIAEIARAHGHELDLFELLPYIGGDRTPRTAMIDCVRRVRAAGCRTAVVTNNIIEGRDFWRSLFPVDELFDVIVDSSDVGMRKPDPRIYRHTLALLEVADPGRAAFLDDFPANVAGAEAVGMIGILVEDDPTAAIAAVDALLAGS